MTAKTYVALVWHWKYIFLLQIISCSHNSYKQKFTFLCTSSTRILKEWS